MTDEQKASKDRLWDEMMQASKALKVFPKGNMGLTPDAVKQSPEYKAAQAAYRTAEARFKAFMKAAKG